MSGAPVPPLGKCDAPRCGMPAEVTNRFGARYCAGHAYLAEPQPASQAQAPTTTTR